MSDLVKEWYETKENVNEMKHWENPKLKKWEHQVSKYFPAQARILDVGCGLGREAFVLTDMGFEVTGIDISQEVIRQVQELSNQKGYDIRFSVYDGHVLPYDTETFDVVIIWAQTFGLLYGSDYKASFLQECKRVLVKNGLLSYSGHDFEFDLEHYPNCMKEGRFYPYENTDLYWETFHIDELCSYAKKAGFEIVCSGIGEIYRPEDGTVLHCLCKRGKE